MRAPPLLLLVLALLLAGCDPTLLSSLGPSNPPPPPSCDELAQQEAAPQNLSFETISRESVASQYWPQGEVGLLIAANAQELDEILAHVEDESATALQAVNFEDSLAVAAFSGSKSHGAWQFCITSITYQESEVTLHTHLVDSPVAPDITASYYHLVRLPREGLPEGEVTFSLALTRHDYVNPTGRQRELQRSDEEIVASVTHSLP